MGVRENSISTCGCKDADARSDECCLWDGGAVMFRRTSRKTRYQGGQECGCQKCRCVGREGRRKWRARCVGLVYCTSTRRLRSRIYFPSLYFWDCSYALSCDQRKEFVSRKGNGRRIGTRDVHIFPAEYGAAFAAVDVSHGVVACSHLTVIRFAFDNVNPAHVHPLASTRHDRASIRSYTSSNK